ncbi:helix-turn-helix transcriptional regulator [Streptomyces uncialis]|uniref:helix-turn-helix transcriptional regulator n=1 Tax=Streptomyces uncialis TaxID=1048205 RepID=UPI003662FBC3
MVDPAPDLVTIQEIAARTGTPTTTVRNWTRRPDWPASPGKKGRANGYPRADVDAWLAQHTSRNAAELEPRRLYTGPELEAAGIGITAGTIRADMSVGRWPAPDDTTDGINRWYGATATQTLAARRPYNRSMTSGEITRAISRPSFVSDPEKTPVLLPGFNAQLDFPRAPALAWQPGDVVLDGAGNIRVRTDHPHWVWGYPNEGATRAPDGRPSFPSGSLSEEEVVRPLTLLVRDGRPVPPTIAG